MHKGSGEPLKEPCTRPTAGERATGKERRRLAQWIEALRRVYSRVGSVSSSPIQNLEERIQNLLAT